MSTTDLRFGYPGGVLLLDIRAFELARGEALFLHGPSGSGKSTLLNLLAGTLKPTTGTIALGGHDLTQASGARRDHIRGDHLGLVFQQFNLLSFMSVLENVLLPCRFWPRRRARAGRPWVARSGCARLAARPGLA